jgi:hypothetical protein
LPVALGFLRQCAERDLFAQPVGHLQQRGVEVGGPIPCPEACI